MDFGRAPSAVSPQTFSLQKPLLLLGGPAPESRAETFRGAHRPTGATRARTGRFQVSRGLHPCCAEPGGAPGSRGHAGTALQELLGKAPHTQIDHGWIQRQNQHLRDQTEEIHRHHQSKALVLPEAVKPAAAVLLPDTRRPRGDQVLAGTETWTNSPWMHLGTLPKGLHPSRCSALKPVGF